MRTYFFISSRAAGRAVASAILLAFFVVSAQAAERTPVTYAGFSFAGAVTELGGRYPYSSRLVYAHQTVRAADGGYSVTLKRGNRESGQSYYEIGPEGAAFHRALREAHYRSVEPLRQFELKARVESDDSGSFHRYGLSTTLVHESVSAVPVPDYNRRTRSWEEGGGVMAFFKLAFLVLILDFRDNSLRDAIPFTCIGKKLYSSPPTDAQILEEMKKLYLGTADGKESLVARQLARNLARVSLDGGAKKTIQVSGVSFGEDARAALGPVLERRDRADFFVSVELSARLASLLNARVIPPLFDYSINQIVLQHPDVGSRMYEVPPADYRMKMEISSFDNAIAERTTSANAYALSATALLEITNEGRKRDAGEWRREVAVALGKTRPIPKAMAENWPFGVSYFDALPALCRGVAEHMGEVRPTAGWEF